MLLTEAALSKHAPCAAALARQGADAPLPWIDHSLGHSRSAANSGRERATSMDTSAYGVTWKAIRLL